jgi:hypothetical protein
VALQRALEPPIELNTGEPRVESVFVPLPRVAETQLFSKLFSLSLRLLFGPHFLVLALYLYDLHIRIFNYRTNPPPYILLPPALSPPARPFMLPTTNTRSSSLAAHISAPFCQLSAVIVVSQHRVSNLKAESGEPRHLRSLFKPLNPRNWVTGSAVDCSFLFFPFSSSPGGEELQPPTLPYRPRRRIS